MTTLWLKHVTWSDKNTNKCWWWWNAPLWLSVLHLISCQISTHRLADIFHGFPQSCRWLQWCHSSSVKQFPLITVNCSVNCPSLHSLQVIFHDIADTYPTDADICCRYSLTDSVTVSRGDRIALYRVGWSCVQEHIAFELVPMTGATELQVHFKGVFGVVW